MFVNQRANQIMQYLKVKKRATIGELAEALFASESSIRRDLTQLQNSGLVARFHGGAILLEGDNEVSIFVRAEKESDAKEICADIALACMEEAPFKDCNTLFIDNSSTCLALAKRMDLTNKTVITNGLQVALQLSQKNDINLIVPGGSVNLNSNAVTGSLAIRTLDMFHIDLMLCSCASLTLDGAYELSFETSQIKRTALVKSRYRMLVATEEKFALNAPYRAANLSDFTAIVTNATNETVQPYRDKELAIYNA